MAMLRLIPALLGILLFVAVAFGWLGDLDRDTSRSRPRAARQAAAPSTARTPIVPDFSVSDFEALGFPNWRIEEASATVSEAHAFSVPLGQVLLLEGVAVTSRADTPVEGIPRASLLIRTPQNPDVEYVLGPIEAGDPPEVGVTRFAIRLTLPAGTEIRLRVEAGLPASAVLEGRIFALPGFSARALSTSNPKP